MGLKVELLGTQFSQSITHNLVEMAAEAGLYTAIWRPKDFNISKANELIKYLEIGLRELKAKSTYFRQFSPENGFGSYDGLVQFVENYLEACKQNPNALVEVQR